MEVSRIKRLSASSRGKFFKRVYTNQERRYCRSRPRPEESYAARFAAKEAVLKALGVGVTPARLPEVEVRVAKGTGPSIELHGRTAAAAKRQGVAHVWISLTHTGEIAMAFAVVEGSTVL